MMNMMSYGWSSGIGSLAFWLHIHWFFGLTFLGGGFLFLLWASRSLGKESLKSLSLWLLATGLVGALLTAPMGALGWQLFMGQWKGGPMMDRGAAREMMRWDRDLEVTP
jgi:hypothetical protein